MDAQLIFLLTLGFLAGLMDAAVGGGGLLQIPGLFNFLPRGMPVATVMGINKFASFCGTLTYSGNSRAHKSAVAVPEDRLLVETDAPDLPPPEPDVPALGVVNGKAVNEPANLVCVVRKLAELRRCTEEHIADITWRNASHVLQPARRA